MKFAVSVDDRTYSMTVPWWLLAGMLLVGLLWQPATAWAADRFNDVPDSNIFHDDIDWMADTGVTAGCNPPANDEFCPGDNVTREQMAAFIRRLETKGVFMRADAVESRLSALESDVARLESLLAGMSRTQVDGRDTLRLEAMNVQVVNGAGDTHTTNGLGNLIVGYHEDHTTTSCVPSDSDCQYLGDGAAEDRSGSHNLLVGVDHGYTSYGGLLAGLDNTTEGILASVSGGVSNVASGSQASVSGGGENVASGTRASVSGGLSNVASGLRAWVSGGVSNVASGRNASVFGGEGNEASGRSASVSGGVFNVASGSQASVSGGLENVASSFYASVSGGGGNVASGVGASVSGGDGNEASGTESSILGGEGSTVSTEHACHPSCA